MFLHFFGSEVRFSYFIFLKPTAKKIYTDVSIHLISIAHPICINKNNYSYFMGYEDSRFSRTQVLWKKNAANICKGFFSPLIWTILCEMVEEFLGWILYTKAKSGKQLLTFYSWIMHSWNVWAFHKFMGRARPPFNLLCVMLALLSSNTSF